MPDAPRPSGLAVFAAAAASTARVMQEEWYQAAYPSVDADGDEGAQSFLQQAIIHLVRLRA